jgi:DtxR family Mn-dependent transcriptional regulator
MAKSKTLKLSASLEDYLEAIFNLSNKEGHAHCTDIAEEMNVAKPSVTEALKKLKTKGLANYEPYGSVTLTKKGLTAAGRIARKHSIIKSFFVNVLGIKPEVAQSAACKAEHVFGAEVISKLLSFSEYIEKDSKTNRNLAKNFQKYYKALTANGK